MSAESLWQEDDVEREGLRLETSFQPAVSLALVHNHVPLARAITVTNTSDSTVQDVQVTLSMDGRGTTLAEPWRSETIETLAPGQQRRWDDLRAFVPDHTHLAQLNESHPATVTVRVTRAWGTDVVHPVGIQMLAHNEWFNAPSFYESLAAFVQPNTHAVGVLLGGAAELLREHTGSASLSGYQDGPERASRVAAAIYEALRRHGVRYVSPPASFEETGQKVRTTAQVLKQRLGTCVDLTVTYAACLEQAGIHPLLWIVEGHAFAGYLRDGGTLGQTVVTEPNMMINLAESGQVVPVEALFYETGSAGSFAAAVASAKQHLAEPEGLHGLVDVHASRRAGTRPLPSEDDRPPAVGAEEHPTVTVEGSGLDLPEDLLARPGEDDVLLDVADDAPARVRQWKRALLDLSTRNRLLNLRPSGEVLDLHVPGESLALLDDIVHEGKPISLIAQDDLSDLQRLQGARRVHDLEADVVRHQLVDEHTVFVGVTEQTYLARMRRLQRAARTMFEETGNSNLHLAVGALVHRTSTGREARAPLFLLPVKIEGGAGRSAFQFRIDTAGVASPNHCLVEWLRIKHGVQIEALETPMLDHSGINIVAALPAIRAALVEHRLDARIDEIAALAICEFSTFGMWRDLDHSWGVLARSPVAEHLALRPGETFVDPSVPPGDAPLRLPDEAEAPLPIPADGSQLRAVAMAASGQSFVLEGPPGTGKSQTITNLIAHALAAGKTVLFVAEKQAALDVVKRRLTDIGLSDFTLDLHGKNQRPAEIRAQLKRAIDNRSEYDRRGWEAVRATLRARHAPLVEYPDKVHARNGLDASLWSAFENLCQYGEGPSAPIPARFVADGVADEHAITDALRKFGRAARTADLRPVHPWSLVGDVPEMLDTNELEAVANELEWLRASVANNSRLRTLLERADGPSSLETLLPRLEEQIGGVAPTAAQLTAVAAPSWTSAKTELIAEVEAFQTQHATVLGVLARSFVEHGDTAGLAAAADAVQGGIFGRRRRIETFEETLRPLLADPGAAVTPAAVPGLIMGISAARTHAEKLQHMVRDALAGAAPSTWTPLADDPIAPLDKAIERLERGQRFRQEHPDLWRLLEDSPDAGAEELDLLRGLVRSWSAWYRLLGVKDGERQRWLGERHWFEAWTQDGPIWRKDVADSADAAVQRWAQLIRILEPLRTAGLDDLRDALIGVRIPADLAEVAYLRGVAEASLRERRDAGGLRAFDAAVHDGEIADYAAAAAAARAEQVTALPSELLARRPYKADGLTGVVGELRRRLDAKRNGMAFRQLMERYGEPILQAAPCFFVSPASLAQYVPPGSVTFDLVVFDEASQVTVAQAIGAIGRGRSAVIVGDSQQMPPTSVGKAKLNDSSEEDGEDGEVLEDLESILTECIESGLPREWLSWHYRSQDETLIAFSNAQYYEGKLASLPSPGGDPTAGIELRRVQGHFNREDKQHGFRTNQVEAEAIVAEIRRRLADPELAGQSLGVVTFNSQQRDLVLNLLEECGDPLVTRQLREDANEGIFVKNLENVQGDERDTILFSIAFSKKPDGGPLPMNFGPLGQTGGEKRLNVAITRARRKVVLFLSFEPGDIDLGRTSSRGIAHLRSYLELAAHGPGDLPSSPGRSVIGVDHVRETIAVTLREQGYEVETDYGLSDFSLDLVVREPGAPRWQVSIVLDGPRWASRPTVTDRDLTPLLLKALMGWGGVLRIWLPEWIDARERVVERVRNALSKAKVAEAEAEARRKARADEQQAALENLTDGVDEDVSDALANTDVDDFADDGVEVETFTFTNEAQDEGEAPEGAEPAVTALAAVQETVIVGGGDRLNVEMPYAEVPATRLGNREDLGRTGSTSVRKTITDAVRETVEIEGPITTTRLARSIGRRFGFDRVAAGRQQFILEHVPKELLRESAFGTFIWPRDLEQYAWRGFRTTPEEIDRPLTDIAPEEIINAMAFAAAEFRPRDDEELFRATLALFGQRRLTGTTTERLAACRDLAIERSRLLREEGGPWRPGA